MTLVPAQFHEFTTNPDTGTLTPIAGSPIVAGEAPHSVAVDPSGKFVYTANFFGDSVSGYTINPTTGALTAIAGSPFTTQLLTLGPLSVAVDPNGKFAYVASNDSVRPVSGYNSGWG
jgi:6-phosphogluconolactonase